MGLILSFVAFGYNSTPHVNTEFSPFFVLHRREAMLPVWRYLDEPWFDLEFKTWHCRSWKARDPVHERHLKQEKAYEQWQGNSKLCFLLGLVLL